MSSSGFIDREEEERLRRQRELDEQYVRGYLEQPETPEEIGLAEAILADVWAELPWKDGGDGEEPSARTDQ